MSKNLMKVWFFLIVFCAAGPMGAWNYMVDFPMYLPKAYVLLSLCLLLFIDFKKSVLLKYLHVLVLLMSCIFGARSGMSLVGTWPPALLI